MKKTLLLSVVASTMIMAGGDIAPVEPVVETPAPVVAEASGWDFNGQAVAYYQTSDAGDSDLFAGTTTNNNLGIQLGAVNKDLFAGIGTGVELSGLYRNKDFSNGRMQDADGSDQHLSAAITQAYLTYGIGNTSIKAGLQKLPKALSPFAFSEGWNVFQNTFGSVLVINSDLPDTTLVGAWVKTANDHDDLGSFGDMNDADGVWMLTAQNKSIEGLTLTGTWYYAPDMLITEDVNILWGDAKFAISDYSIGLQGGTILGADDANLGEDTTAFGAKAGADFGMFDASVAFSSVDEGALPIHNLGTGIKTPLYTQMIANQGVIKTDADYVKVAAGAKALGGKFGVAYGYAINNEDDIVGGADNNPYELDVTYKTKVLNDSTTLFAGYILKDDDVDGQDATNIIRVWGRYNF